MRLVDELDRAPREMANEAEFLRRKTLERRMIVAQNQPLQINL